MANKAEDAVMAGALPGEIPVPLPGLAASKYVMAKDEKPVPRDNDTKVTRTKEALALLNQIALVLLAQKETTEQVRLIVLSHITEHLDTALAKAKGEAQLGWAKYVHKYINDLILAMINLNAGPYGPMELRAPSPPLNYQAATTARLFTPPPTDQK